MRPRLIPAILLVAFGVGCSGSLPDKSSRYEEGNSLEDKLEDGSEYGAKRPSIERADAGTADKRPASFD